MLITNVSARPRIRSNVPRWTSRALQTMATPFPTPATTTQQDAATQTFGLTAVAEVARCHQGEAGAVDAARRRSGRAARALTSAAEHEAGAHRAEEEPEAEVAGVERVLGEEDLGRRWRRRRERGDSPRDEHGPHRRRAERAPKPSREIAPVTTRERALALQQARRDPQHEHDRDDERHRIDRVGRRRPGPRPSGSRRRAARSPSSGSRPPAAARWRAGSSASGTRFGHARRRRPGGRSRSRGLRRTRGRRSIAALGANGSATKTPTRSASAAIISERRSSRSRSGPSRSPTTIVGRNSTMKTAATQRPELARRPLLHVDRERHRREQRPDARTERGKEEVAEPRQPQRPSWADDGTSRACARKYHLCGPVTRRPKGRVPTRQRRTRSPPECRP